MRGWEWRYLWQQTRSDALFTLCQEATEINSLSVSPDGNWLAVGVRHRGGLAVWDLRTRQELFRVAKNESYVRAVFSPTEPLLAFVSFKGSPSGQTQYALRIWNVVTRQMVIELPLDNGCLGLAFAQDGRTLATSTASGTGGVISLWRMPDGTKLASYPSEQDHVDPGTSFAATPDLSLAAYGSSSGRICVMDLRNGKELWRAVASKEYVLSLGFSPD